MSTNFRDRNPVVIGAASIMVILLLMLGAFNSDKLPLIGGGDTYYAAFKEAGGMKVNDEVRVAGVRIGKVKSIKLDNGEVKIAFLIEKNVDFGNQTEAQIKIKTLLGSTFLALVPSGSGQMKAGSTIPVSRTTSPYDVVQAFSGLAQRAGKIDVNRLAKSLNTLAALTKNTPKSFKGTLKGLSALSLNVAKRDSQLNSLLKNTETVSSILANRDQDIVGLMRDSDVLLRAVVARRQAIHRLLVSTSQLSVQLTGLVKDSRADLQPALKNLDGVVQLLNKNQSNIDQSLRLLAPFTRVFSSTLGNGPWFDTFIQNIPPVPGLSTSTLGLGN